MKPRVIVVSPHLDDAALSCGGGIARLARAGVPVTVVTVFTADQAEGEPLSILARRTHDSWGIGDRPFAARRLEDVAALSVLGADHMHLGLLDAIYRRSPRGNALYSDPLSTPTAQDAEHTLPILLAALSDVLAPVDAATRVFCPSGTCGHVDHVLVRQAVGQLIDIDAIVTFEEYPYSSRQGASTEALAHGWSEEVVTLSAEELESRIAAIACYVSQLRGLFPSPYERLREIASARLPLVGPWLVRPPNAVASRIRMAAQVRRDTQDKGGERYRWVSRRESPFPHV